MRRMKKVLAMVLTTALVAGLLPAASVLADGTGEKVLTLGADLSGEQKSMMLKYFGVEGENIKTLTVTNADERDFLSDFVPLEEIGTKTYSCALVRPTTAGGIQVKTANLTWVTSNMIASTLSTCGVVNCQVLAASPFSVSGTGALTGIIMAYESASGRKLNKKKVRAGTRELITMARIGDRIGPPRATLIINQAKVDVIQNHVTTVTDITEIVNNISVEYNISLDDEDLDLLVELLQDIADLDYDEEDLADMEETLDHVEENLVEEIEEEEAEDDILAGTDDAALGEDAVFDSTEDGIMTLQVTPEAESEAEAAEEPAEPESDAEDAEEPAEPESEAAAEEPAEPESEAAAEEPAELESEDETEKASGLMVLSEGLPGEEETEEETEEENAVPASSDELFDSLFGSSDSDNADSSSAAETPAAEPAQESDEAAAEDAAAPSSSDELFDSLFGTADAGSDAGSNADSSSAAETPAEEAGAPTSSDDLFESIFEDSDSYTEGAADEGSSADAWGADTMEDGGWTTFDESADEGFGADASAADAMEDDGWTTFDESADEEFGADAWGADVSGADATGADASGSDAAGGFTISDLSVSPKGTDVDPDLDALEISCFSGTLKTGSGSLTLYDENDTQIERVSMSDGSKVESSSDEVDVYLDTILSGNTSYYVILSDDALELDGVSLKASSASDWKFTTSSSEAGGSGEDDFAEEGFGEDDFEEIFGEEGFFWE